MEADFAVASGKSALSLPKLQPLINLASVTLCFKISRRRGLLGYLKQAREQEPLMFLKIARSCTEDRDALAVGSSELAQFSSRPQAASPSHKSCLVPES